jgi:hypothetical protein
MLRHLSIRQSAFDIWISSSATPHAILSVQGRRPCLTKGHEHHQKPRNAPARDLSNSRRNHSAFSHYHPNDHNGHPGAGSWHFDSDWEIAHASNLRY